MIACEEKVVLEHGLVVIDAGFDFTHMITTLLIIFKLPMIVL